MAIRTNGAAIREFRRLRGLTQHEVAQAARVGRPFIAQIEAGQRQPSTDTVESIAAALGVPVESITYTPETVTRGNS